MFIQQCLVCQNILLKTDGKLFAEDPYCVNKKNLEIICLKCKLSLHYGHHPLPVQKTLCSGITKFRQKKVYTVQCGICFGKFYLTVFMSWVYTIFLSTSLRYCSVLNTKKYWKCTLSKILCTIKMFYPTSNDVVLHCSIFSYIFKVDMQQNGTNLHSMQNCIFHQFGECTVKLAHYDKLVTLHPYGFHVAFTDQLQILMNFAWKSGKQSYALVSHFQNGLLTHIIVFPEIEDIWIFILCTKVGT